MHVCFTCALFWLKSCNSGRQSACARWLLNPVASRHSRSQWTQRAEKHAGRLRLGLVSSPVVPARNVMSCHVMSCHVMSCHAMPCHVTSRRVMPCHVVSCRVASCRVGNGGHNTLTQLPHSHTTRSHAAHAHTAHYHTTRVCTAYSFRAALSTSHCFTDLVCPPTSSTKAAYVGSSGPFFLAEGWRL